MTVRVTLAAEDGARQQVLVEVQHRDGVGHYTPSHRHLVAPGGRMEIELHSHRQFTVRALHEGEMPHHDPLLLVDHSRMKLGRLPSQHDERVPRLCRMLDLSDDPPPAADWHSRVTAWPMMGNDRLGDCTCAGVGHAIEQWTVYAGAPRVMSEAMVEAFYERFGYEPGVADTDGGAVEIDVLTSWASQGVPSDGPTIDRLEGFARVRPEDMREVRQAISWFGNLYVGVGLPLSAQTQSVWDVPAGGAQGQGACGSWGGHCVLAVGYDQHGVDVVTWGAVKRLTWAFWGAYVDEAYALLNRDFVAANGTTPSGLSWEQLEQDMSRLRQG